MTDTTQNKLNLHPFNMLSGELPDFKDPAWKPRSYPPKSELLPGTAPRLPPAMTEEEFKRAEADARVKAQVMWPTMSDYCHFVYTKELVGSGLLEMLEPRKLAAPGGYASPKHVAVELYTGLSEIKFRIKHNIRIEPTEVTALLINYSLLKASIPVFYVSEDFIRAVAATELPGDFILDDLHWPMPAMALGIPLKFSQEFLGRDIGYIVTARLEEGTHSPPAWLPELPPILCPAKVGFKFNSYVAGCMESFVTSWLTRDRVNEAGTKYAYTDYSGGDLVQVAQDAERSRKIGALLLKLLVVLNTRPGFVEHGSITRPAKVNKRTGAKEQSELWSPNIIGFKFKPQWQQAAQGTHASPRFHWRKGHITHQRVGPLNSPDFVPVAAIPRISEGPNTGEFDWLKAAPEVRAAFWRCHVRRWVEPVLINFEEPAT